MRIAAIPAVTVLALLLATQNGRGDGVLFEDRFAEGLSDQWQVVGLQETDYRGYAFFQVGPSASGKYLNFFQSAIRKERKARGFCLVAAGAPDGTAHWVRFEEFRVVQHRAP